MEQHRRLTNKKENSHSFPSNIDIVTFCMGSGWMDWMWNFATRWTVSQTRLPEQKGSQKNEVLFMRVFHLLLFLRFRSALFSHTVDHGCQLGSRRGWDIDFLSVSAAFPKFKSTYVLIRITKR